MSETTHAEDWKDPESGKLPGSINILTILTFIGSGILLIFILGSKKLMEFSLKMVDRPEVAEKMTEKELADIEKMRTVYDLMSSNWIAYLIPSLIGIALCIYGAIQMRKLKKQGFYTYVIGEVLPIIGGIIVLGFSNQFSSPSQYIMGIGIPLLFIFLYSRNLKYLK